MSTGVSFRPIRLGVAGMGGYAHYITGAILDQPAEAPPAELVAVCDPQLNQYPDRKEILARRGVRSLHDFEDLLNQSLDAVWLPLPIDLHCPFTELALRAGCNVMCEKPAAGAVQDVDAMIKARDTAKRIVGIGFQDVYQPCVSAIKKRIAAGEFGRPIRARVIGCWPRSESYFRRNDWAGKFRRDGRWVMDSPANNALAHFLHLALFLLGGAEAKSAVPREVTAELYRANPIENYDTCSLRFVLHDDVPLHVAFTHACRDSVNPTVTIETEDATIEYINGRGVFIRKGQKVESLALVAKPQFQILLALRDWIRDGVPTLGATLESARTHVVSLNSVSEVSAVLNVPAEQIDSSDQLDGAPLNAIPGIASALKVATAENLMLHETGLFEWTAQPTAQTIDPNYSRFLGPKAKAPKHAAKHYPVRA